MPTDPDAVRERAWVERHRESGDVMWIAEDPVTECAGAGRVEAEAIGNLVAVVDEFESAGEEPLLKTPGPVVVRESAPSQSSSLVDQVLSLF